jgi:hypothetical protein
MNGLYTAHMDVPPHRVEIWDKRSVQVVGFETPGEAFQFWLRLRRGIVAKLFQHGILTGEGNGRESGV